MPIQRIPALLMVVIISALCVQGRREKVHVPKLPKDIAERFAYIPMSASPIEGRVVTTRAFFIAKWEVSNSEYNEFVASVKASGDTALLRTVLVDSLGWRSTMGFQEPYIEYYHAHPAYAAYPVVNVRFAAAQAYCSWLAERINARPGIHVICRLPTRDEWVMAGEGGQVLAPYPWGSRLTNEKGQYLCNYHHIGDERIHQDPGPKAYTIEDPAEAYFTVDRFIRSGEGRYATQINTDDMDEMSPVRSYWPSSNGLYNMSGNAAEMIDSAGVAVGGSWINTGYDVRLWSTMTYDVPRPWIGFRPLLEIIP